jgi:hypothetical protein
LYRRKRGEDGHRRDRRVDRFLHSLAQSLEPPVDRAKVESERAAELGIAEAVAKLQVEEEIVLGGKRRDGRPNIVRGVLVPHKALGVGEAIGVDLCESTAIGRSSLLAG